MAAPAKTLLPGGRCAGRDVDVTAARSKADDGFEALDHELHRATEEAARHAAEDHAARAEINRQVITDFWKIWKRFNETNVHFVMEPGHEAWAVFQDTFPDGSWTWRPGFNAGSVTAIELVDRTTEHGRTGDGLKVVHYDLDGQPRVKVTFEYCEGEHYSKSSGWKRIWSLHTLLDSALERANIDRMQGLFTDVVKVWFESHLRRNRDILIKHLRNAYPKAETFSE